MGAADPVSVLVKNHRRFRAFLEKRVGSREDAEEILQIAFVKGIERGGGIRDEERAVAVAALRDVVMPCAAALLGRPVGAAAMETMIA